MSQKKETTKKAKKTVSKELDLLIKRQTKGEEKTLKNELTLVEKLEAELKKRKKEAKQKLKGEEEKKIIQFGRSLMEEHGLEEPEQLHELVIGKQEETNSKKFSEQQNEALQKLITYGRELTNQPNKFIDINAVKHDLAYLHEVFEESEHQEEQEFDEEDEALDIKPIGKSTSSILL